MIGIGIGLWLRNGGGGTPFAIPAGATAVFSVKRIPGYAGSCIQVVDGAAATHDIGFNASGYLDTAALNVLTGPLTVSIWYDQTGNGNHLTQGTAANRPECTSLNEWVGLRPVSFCGADTLRSQWMTIPSLALSRVNFTAYMALAPRVSLSTNMYWEFNDAVSVVDLNLNTAGTALQTSGPSTVQFSSGDSASFPRFLPTTVHFVSNGSNQIAWNRGHKQTGAARTAKTMAGGIFGRALADSTNNLRADMFFLAFYPTAHADAVVQATDAALVSAFTEPSSFTYLLDYNGSSLIDGSYRSTHNQSVPWLQAWPSTWEIYVTAIGGRSLAALYAARASVDIPLYTSARTKNIAVLDAPSNDINVATYADQATAEAAADTIYTGTTLPYVSALLAAGYSAVVVPTIIARASFTAINFQEFARVRYNSNVVAGGVTNGYMPADRAGDTRLNDASNATYFSDGTHCTDAGYVILAAIDKAAILANISVSLTASMTATGAFSAVFPTSAVLRQSMVAAAGGLAPMFVNETASRQSALPGIYLNEV